MWRGAPSPKRADDDETTNGGEQIGMKWNEVELGSDHVC